MHSDVIIKYQYFGVTYSLYLSSVRELLLFCGLHFDYQLGMQPKYENITTVDFIDCLVCLFDMQYFLLDKCNHYYRKLNSYEYDERMLMK